MPADSYYIRLIDCTGRLCYVNTNCYNPPELKEYCLLYRCFDVRGNSECLERRSPITNEMTSIVTGCEYSNPDKPEPKGISRALH